MDFFVFWVTAVSIVEIIPDFGRVTSSVLIDHIIQRSVTGCVFKNVILSIIRTNTPKECFVALDNALDNNVAVNVKEYCLKFQKMPPHQADALANQFYKWSKMYENISDKYQQKTAVGRLVGDLKQVPHRKKMSKHAPFHDIENLVYAELKKYRKKERNFSK